MTLEISDTLLEKMRLDVLATVLQSLGLGCLDAPIVSGSMGLQMMGGLYRLPNDIDCISPSGESVRQLEGVYQLTRDRTVELKRLGAIPFNPGKRVIPGVSFIAIIANGRGQKIDKVLIDFQLHAEKYELAAADGAEGRFTGEVRLAPVEAILADKCHALLRKRRDGRTNTRWMDLADLHCSMTSQTLQIRADALTSWFDLAQRYLPVQDWVDHGDGPPREWLGPWRKLQAVNITRDLPSLDDCWWSVRDFFDTRLDGTVWSATLGRWEAEC